MRVCLPLIATTLFLAACQQSFTEPEKAKPEFQRFGSLSGQGFPQALRVNGGHLIFTHQFLPLDKEGNLVGPEDPVVQIDTVLSHLRNALESAESDLAHLVRLHVVVPDFKTAGIVEDAVKDLLPEEELPTITFVEGATPREGALVAIDAIAATHFEVGDKPLKNVPTKSPYGEPGVTQVSVLPEGPAVFISGQAEKGENLRESTRLTMESLGKTLEWLGIEKTRVVQVKSFLTPIAGAGEVREEIDAFFGQTRTPSLCFVEWNSSLPIEIEMVVAGNPLADGEAPAALVEYLTPPEMTASPVYSKVTRVNGGDWVYCSGMTGAAESAPGSQVRSLFLRMETALQRLGSDLEHLAKATYYCSLEETSTALNEMRPDIYNPERPPAASKAMVPGVGYRNKAVEVDMIAVAP